MKNKSGEFNNCPKGGTMALSQQEINKKLFDAVTCIQETLHSMKTILSHQPEREVPEFIDHLAALDKNVEELRSSFAQEGGVKEERK
ncbi:MAG TPA: hypothetical protein VHO03_09270 [Ignavibacteriales bacterium]|nr:hypothetical protein [Ignavibacteriales bacterium]